ncbi:hypothetical protein [Tessaracoccus sp. G1721]
MSPTAQSTSALHTEVLEGWKQAINLARGLPSTERAAFARIISARAEGLAALESTMPGDTSPAAETHTFVQGIAKDKQTAIPTLVGVGGAILGLIGTPAVVLAFQAGAGFVGALFTVAAAGGALFIIRGVQAGYQGTVTALEERSTRGAPVRDVLNRIAASETKLFKAFGRPVPNPPLTMEDLKMWFGGGTLLGAFLAGAFWMFS